MLKLKERTVLKLHYQYIHISYNKFVICLEN